MEVIKMGKHKPKTQIIIEKKLIDDIKPLVLTEAENRKLEFYKEQNIEVKHSYPGGAEVVRRALIKLKKNNPV